MDKTIPPGNVANEEHVTPFTVELSQLPNLTDLLSYLRNSDLPQDSKNYALLTKYMNSAETYRFLLTVDPPDTLFSVIPSHEVVPNQELSP